MAEATNEETYVFARAAVLRAIRKLEACRIHEHFAGYLAILRGLKATGGDRVRSKAIWDLHNRYLSVEGDHDRAIYVRPFASRGSGGLHIFNPNVAGSYGASSIRAGSKLFNVIEVEGEGPSTIYSLKENHASLARKWLLKRRVPVGALATFFYRDYGLQLATPSISRVIDIFREEFGLSQAILEEKAIFDQLFEDDAGSFSPDDLELLQEAVTADG